MESLEIVLEKSVKAYGSAQKAALAERKNNYYRSLLGSLTPDDIFPNVLQLLEALKKRKIKIAIGSSSKNTPYILEKIGLSTCFDAIADGNEIKNSKPDPEVFLLAAEKLGISPAECAVVEDAYAGIQAAKAGGMKAIGVGYAMDCKQADLSAASLSKLSVEKILDV